MRTTFQRLLTFRCPRRLGAVTCRRHGVCRGLSGGQGGQRGDEARSHKTASGVTDTIIASIDLSPMGGGLAGRKMRMRKLVVQPGGIVPWHSHEARPANIYIISGSITEYRSSCAVPIEHDAGDVTAEFGPLAHWWKNNTKHPAVLISADILPPDMNPDESM